MRQPLCAGPRSAAPRPPRRCGKPSPPRARFQRKAPNFTSSLNVRPQHPLPTAIPGAKLLSKSLGKWPGRGWGINSHKDIHWLPQHWGLGARPLINRKRASRSASHYGQWNKQRGRTSPRVPVDGSAYGSVRLVLYSCACLCLAEKDNLVLFHLPVISSRAPGPLCCGDQ